MLGGLGWRGVGLAHVGECLVKSKPCGCSWCGWAEFVYRIAWFSVICLFARIEPAIFGHIAHHCDGRVSVRRRGGWGGLGEFPVLHAFSPRPAAADTSCSLHIINKSRPSCSIHHLTHPNTPNFFHPSLQPAPWLHPLLPSSPAWPITIRCWTMPKCATNACRPTTSACSRTTTTSRST